MKTGFFVFMFNSIDETFVSQGPLFFGHWNLSDDGRRKLCNLLLNMFVHSVLHIYYISNYISKS
jgi:hypothetical protein